MNSVVSTGICVKVCSNVLWMGRVGGPLCQRCGDRAIQSRSAPAAAPHDSSSPLFRHAPACVLHFVSAPAVAVVAVVPEGTQNSRALSLCVSFHHVKERESQALLPKCGHSLKTTCLISRCKDVLCSMVSFFNTPFTLNHLSSKYVHIHTYI